MAMTYVDDYDSDAAWMRSVHLAASTGAITVAEARKFASRLNQAVAWNGADKYGRSVASALARCSGCGATGSVGHRCDWCRSVIDERKE